MESRHSAGYGLSHGRGSPLHSGTWLADERKRDWLMLIPAAILFAVVWHFSSREKALGSAATLLLLYVVTSRMWEYRREKWFWLALAVFAAIHIAAIWLVPFRLPSGPTITYILPITMIDGFLMWGALRWLAARLSDRST